MILHKIMRQAQDSLSTYATQTSTQLDYLLMMAQKNLANLPHIDSKAWTESKNIVCLENNHTLITAYKVKELWSVFMVDKSDGAAQKTLLKEIKKESLEYLALGNENFLLSTSPQNSHGYTMLIDSEEDNKSTQFKIENWSGDLRKTEHFLFELRDICNNLIEETKEQPQYPVDISGHDYQLKMASTQYTPTKMMFYENAFLGLGTGYEWNAQGNLACSSIIYKPEIAAKDIASIPEGEICNIRNITEHCNNLEICPDNISPQWQEARGDFISAIKNGIAAYPSWSKERKDSFLDKSISLQELTSFIERCEKPKGNKLKM